MRRDHWHALSTAVEHGVYTLLALAGGATIGKIILEVMR